MIMEEPTSNGYQLNVTLNPDGVINKVNIQAGESLRLFAFVTKLIQESTIDKVPDVTRYFPMWSVDLPEKTTEELKCDLVAILIETAVSNLLRSIADCLDELTWYMELHRFCFPQREMLTDDFNRFSIKTSETLKRQHKSALKNRLEWIDNQYMIKAQHKEILITLNNLRNCFVHRKGIVTELDVNDQASSTLKIQYFRPFIFVLRNDVEIEAVTPFLLHDGEQLKLRAKLEEKTFKVGETISLTLSEFSQICFSCDLFATDLADQLPKVVGSN